MKPANLFDLDFSRWEVVVFSIIPALINIVIFFYVASKLPQNKINFAFSAFVLLSGLWQLGDGLVRISVAPETALEWHRISLAFSLFVIPFGILFTLRSTQGGKININIFMFVGQYLPAIVCLIFMLARQDQYLIEESTFWYWVVNPIPVNFTLVIYGWLILNALIMFFLLWINYAKSNKSQSNQSFLFAVGFTLPVVGGIISAAIFPIIFGLDYIPITTPLVTAFTIAAFFSIKNNNILDYSPKHQWGKIVESMNEGILIVNNEEKIMYANKMFCELVEYEYDEINGKIANELFFDDSEEERKNQMQQILNERKNNQSSQYEVLLKTKTGKKIWVIVNGTPYIDSKGDIVGSIGIHTNIDSTKRSDARFRALVENVGDIITVSDRDGYINYVSPALEKVTGYTFDEMIGRPIFELMHHEQVEESKKMMHDILSQPGVSFPRLNRFKHKNGKYVWVEGLVTNLLENENVKAIVSNYHDITERRESEQKILQKDERLRAILENEPECVKVIDLGGSILEMNPAGLKIIDADSTTQILGTSIFDLVHPEDKEIYLKLHNSVCKGETGTIDFRITSLKNNLRWLESNSVPLRNANGEIYAALSVARDITEIKKKNDELLAFKNRLQYSESRLKQAQTIAHVGNWEYNYSNNTAVWSEEGCRIFGLSSDENNLTFKEWLTYVHPDDLKFVASKINRAWVSFSNSSIQHRIIRKDGSVRFVNSESRFEFDENGKPIGLYGVVQDLTEEKQSKLRLQNLLNVTNDQNARLKNFAYIISHNIRSHSANIIGLVDIMGTVTDKTEGVKVFNMLQSSTHKLSETIENLNDIITIQNTTNKQKSILLLKQEVDKTRDAINALLLQSKATFINNIPENIEIKAVPSYLESILLNLLTNAVKYSSPERLPIIVANVEYADDFTIFTIQDNGIGIDLRKNGEKLFGMYKTFHNNEDATGFGLYITKNQIESMGGKIEVESELGKGTKFKVYLYA